MYTVGLFQLVSNNEFEMIHCTQRGVIGQNSQIMMYFPLDRGSYINAHVLLNLLNELGK